VTPNLGASPRAPPPRTRDPDRPPGRRGARGCRRRSRRWAAGSPARARHPCR
jgi:hypothetical protein